MEEEALSPGMQTPLEKAEGILPRATGRKTAPDFSLAKHTSDFWPSELQENKFYGFIF